MKLDTEFVVTTFQNLGSGIDVSFSDLLTGEFEINVYNRHIILSCLYDAYNYDRKICSEKIIKSFDFYSSDDAVANLIKIIKCSFEKVLRYSFLPWLPLEILDNLKKENENFINGIESILFKNEFLKSEIELKKFFNVTRLKIISGEFDSENSKDISSEVDDVSRNNVRNIIL